MKRILLATAACAVLATAASAQDAANVGIILGFSGPLESITPGMAASAELGDEGGLRLRQAARRPDPDPGPRRLDLHRRRRRDHRRDQPRHQRGRRRDHGRRLLGRHDRDRQQRRDPERRRHGLAVGDLAGAHDDRGRRLLLPHRPLRRPPGRDPRRHRQGEGHRHRRHHLHQQRLRQGLRRRLRRRLPGGSAAPSRSTPRTRTARPTIRPRSRALQASGAPALVVLRLRRPGRRRHHPGLARHRRLRAVLLRRRHVRPEPDRLDRRRDQRQGDRHPARRRGRGRRQVRRASPRPPAWTRPAPTCPRATTPPR